MSETTAVFHIESQDPGSEIDGLEKGTDPSPRTVQPTSAFEPFSFNLRGNSINPLIDISSSLIAMIIRVTDLTDFTGVDLLHTDVRTEIEAIELELHKLGYERVTILAHRYCLCSAIDEAIMCSAWGQESGWSEKSLLSLFHYETWGGEKFFIVLNRLLQEPDRYLDLIEFMYILTTIGFEGKYRVMHNGRSQLEDIIRDVHGIIRKERGDSPEVLLSAKEQIFQKAHHIRRQTPVSVVWIILAIACALTYATYYYRINQFTDDVVMKLRSLI